MLSGERAPGVTALAPDPANPYVLRRGDQQRWRQHGLVPEVRAWAGVARVRAADRGRHAAGAGSARWPARWRLTGTTTRSPSTGPTRPASRCRAWRCRRARTPRPADRAVPGDPRQRAGRRRGRPAPDRPQPRLGRHHPGDANARGRPGEDPPGGRRLLEADVPRSRTPRTTPTSCRSRSPRARSARSPWPSATSSRTARRTRIRCHVPAQVAEAQVYSERTANNQIVETNPEWLINPQGAQLAERVRRRRGTEHDVPLPGPLRPRHDALEVRTSGTPSSPCPPWHGQPVRDRPGRRPDHGDRVCLKTTAVGRSSRTAWIATIDVDRPEPHRQRLHRRRSTGAMATPPRRRASARP